MSIVFVCVMKTVPWEPNNGESTYKIFYSLFRSDRSIGRSTYRPLRELSTAFSMNSMIVRDLNFAHEPNEKVP